MYPSAEKRPVPNQASKINNFARIVKVFKLIIFVESIIVDVEGLWLYLWPVLTHAIT